MCTLAHVLEARGIATVALVSVRPVAERMHPPRALSCDFPLGRPLGRPGDPAFQRDVLTRAFGLLESDAGPVLDDHPEVITAREEPLACPLPPRHDPGVPEAVAEARALRSAFERTRARRGTTSVGRVTDADGIPAVVEAFVRIAEGVPWRDAGVPGNVIAAAHDVRTYYEEAALALVDGPPPEAGTAEEWFHARTAAGRTVMKARRAMKEAGAPFPLWFYMAPGTRE